MAEQRYVAGRLERQEGRKVIRHLEAALTELDVAKGYDLDIDTFDAISEAEERTNEALGSLAEKRGLA